MLFTIENEKQNKMFFLDVQIVRENKTFTTSVYHNLAFSGVYAHFDSFLPNSYNFGTAYALTCRCFQICLCWTKLHTALLFLKLTFFKKMATLKILEINVSKDL